MTIDRHRFVFVGGMHRSATTLVAEILAKAPEASGIRRTASHMGEGQFLQRTYPVGGHYGGVTKWALDPRSHLTEADVSPTTTVELWNSWKPFWDTSREVLIEKTPLNISKFRYLNAAFPDAHFVAVVRHPISQALAVQKWAPTSRMRLGSKFDLLVRNWLAAHKRLEADLHYLPNMTVITYEELILAPVPTVGKLASALALSLDPAAAGAVDNTVLQQYQARWEGARPVGGGMAPTGRLRRIEHGLRPLVNPIALRAAHRSVDRHYAEEIDRYGYSSEDLTLAMKTPNVLRAF